jgi:hypothetical protein
VTHYQDEWDEVRRAIMDGGPENLDHPALDVVDHLQSKMEHALAGLKHPFPECRCPR